MADDRQPEDSASQWDPSGGQEPTGTHGANGFSSSSYRTCQTAGTHATSVPFSARENGFNGELTGAHAITAEQVSARIVQEVTAEAVAVLKGEQESQRLPSVEDTTNLPPSPPPSPAAEHFGPLEQDVGDEEEAGPLRRFQNSRERCKFLAPSISVSVPEDDPYHSDEEYYEHPLFSPEWTHSGARPTGQAVAFRQIEAVKMESEKPGSEKSASMSPDSIGESEKRSEEFLESQSQEFFAGERVVPESPTIDTPSFVPPAVHSQAKESAKSITLQPVYGEPLTVSEKQPSVEVVEFSSLGAPSDFSAIGANLEGGNLTSDAMSAYFETSATDVHAPPQVKSEDYYELSRVGEMKNTADSKLQEVTPTVQMAEESQVFSVPDRSNECKLSPGKLALEQRSYSLNITIGALDQSGQGRMSNFSPLATDIMSYTSGSLDETADYLPITTPSGEKPPPFPPLILETAASVTSDSSSPPRMSEEGSNLSQEPESPESPESPQPCERSPKNNSILAQDLPEMLDLAGNRSRLTSEDTDPEIVRRKSIQAEVPIFSDDLLASFVSGEQSPGIRKSDSQLEEMGYCVFSEYSGPMPSPADVISPTNTSAQVFTPSVLEEKVAEQARKLAVRDTSTDDESPTAGEVNEEVPKGFIEEGGQKDINKPVSEDMKTSTLPLETFVTPTVTVTLEEGGSSGSETERQASGEGSASETEIADYERQIRKLEMEDRPLSLEEERELQELREKVKLVHQEAYEEVDAEDVYQLTGVAKDRIAKPVKTSPTSSVESNIDDDKLLSPVLSPSKLKQKELYGSPKRAMSPGLAATKDGKDMREQQEKEATEKKIKDEKEETEKKIRQEIEQKQEEVKDKEAESIRMKEKEKEQEMRQKEEREKEEREIQGRIEKERKEKEEREHKEKEEAERIEKERKEKEQKEKEEAERIEKERKEKEQKEKEEAERIEKERKEKEQKEQEEAERIEKERKEKEQKEQEEAERIEKERKEKEERELKEKEEADRIEKERKEKEEAARIEKERKEKEEADRTEKERKEKEEADRIEKERKEKEEREQKEREEREKKEKQEREIIEREEQEQREREKKEKEERERKEQEAKEKEREEKEEKEREERELREKEEKIQQERKKAEETKTMAEIESEEEELTSGAGAAVVQEIPETCAAIESVVTVEDDFITVVQTIDEAEEPGHSVRFSAPPEAEILCIPGVEEEEDEEEQEEDDEEEESVELAQEANIEPASFEEVGEVPENVGSPEREAPTVETEAPTESYDRDETTMDDSILDSSWVDTQDDDKSTATEQIQPLPKMPSPVQKPNVAQNKQTQQKRTEKSAKAKSKGGRVKGRIATPERKPVRKEPVYIPREEVKKKKATAKQTELTKKTEAQTPSPSKRSGPKPAFRQTRPTQHHSVPRRRLTEALSDSRHPFTVARRSCDRALCHAHHFHFTKTHSSMSRMANLLNGPQPSSASVYIALIAKDGRSQSPVKTSSVPRHASALSRRGYHEHEDSSTSITSSGSTAPRRPMSCRAAMRAEYRTGRAPSMTVSEPVRSRSARSGHSTPRTPGSSAITPGTPPSYSSSSRTPGTPRSLSLISQERRVAVVRTPPKSPATTPKQLRIINQPLPDFKKVKSKVGSIDNIKYQPKGGQKHKEQIMAAEAKHKPSFWIWNSVLRIISFTLCLSAAHSMTWTQGLLNLILNKNVDFRYIQSKCSSKDNLKQPPHGGNVLIPSVKLDYSHVQSRCGSLDRRGYSAGGGNVQIQNKKIDLSHVTSKCGSLDNIHHRPGGGNVRIESVKLDFKDKAHAKVGSLDNAHHTPGGGRVTIESHRLTFRDHAKARVDHGAEIVVRSPDRSRSMSPQRQRDSHLSSSGSLNVTESPQLATLAEDVTAALAKQGL
uniref:microtubule-associated protein 2 isoform X2 n=1 Tax=Doryrhamphus excisus TaxID=161450 RepID=UPI0025AE8856|nr:microtubule-associated protein 2 isoform X2 [Doryrhamphus excisus]